MEVIFSQHVASTSQPVFQNFSLSRLGFLRLPSPQEQVWEEGLENGALFITGEGDSRGAVISS